MSSIERALSGGALRFDLESEREHAAAPDLLARHGRNARTLLKEGGMRVTLVELAAGGGIAEHRADGPITVQGLAGEIRFRVGDEEHELRPGVLVSLPAGVRHAVSSPGGGAFLLTVCRAAAAPPDGAA